MRTAFPLRRAAVIAVVLSAACVVLIFVVVASMIAPNQFGQTEAVAPEGSFIGENRDGDRQVPAWYKIDGSALVLCIERSHIDRTIVHTYPRFGPKGTRELDDRDKVLSLFDLVEDRSFTAAQTINSWNKEQTDWIGGYNTTVELLDQNSECCGRISYNPEYPGAGVAVVTEGVIYTLEGDQSAVIELLDDKVDSLADPAFDPERVLR